MNLPDDGYIVLERVFPPDECTRTVSALNAHAASTNASNAVSSSTKAAAASSDTRTSERRTNEPKHHAAKTHPDPSDVTRAHKIQAVALALPNVVLEIFRNVKIRSEARKALHVLDDGEPLDVFGTKYYPMYPGGTSVNWHQDAYYFGTGGHEAVCVSCAIYLEDATKENGCLRIIPGSHVPNWDGKGALRRGENGILPHERGCGRWSHGDWIVGCPEEEAIDVEVPAGTVVLFDPRIVHGAHPNGSVNLSRASLFGHIVPRSKSFANEYVSFAFGEYKDRHQIT